MKRVLVVALPCVILGGHAEAVNTRPAPPVTQFTQKDIQNVSPPGLIVEVSTSCPRENQDPNFRDYPLAVARNHGGGPCASSTWSGLVTGDMWTNRCTTSSCTRSGPNPVGDNIVDANPIGGQSNLTIALPYFAISDANAATLAELDWWLGGSHWLSLTEAAGIPDSHVYTCIEDPCADGSTAFLDDVNNGTIQMQGWSPSGNQPWTYALPVNEYVVMPPNKLTTDPAKMQSYTVEMDYERADHISDSGTVAFLTQVSQLLQNTSSLGPNELPHTYQLSVRGDELISAGAKGYKNTNSWQSGLDSVSIPQIMALPGFNYYSILLWAGNRYHNIETSWQQSLGVVNGGTLPQQCAPLMQHVMMEFEIAQTSLSDAQTANNLLASWCVPYVQPDLGKGGVLGGPDCYDDQQVLYPAKWGALIGEPYSCTDRRHQNF